MNASITPKKLTGDALEIAAGRMRRPDLADVHQQWLAVEQGAAAPTNDQQDHEIRQRGLFDD